MMLVLMLVLVLSASAGDNADADAGADVDGNAGCVGMELFNTGLLHIYIYLTIEVVKGGAYRVRLFIAPLRAVCV